MTKHRMVRLMSIGVISSLILSSGVRASLTPTESVENKSVAKQVCIQPALSNLRETKIMVESASIEELNPLASVKPKEADISRKETKEKVQTIKYKNGWIKVDLVNVRKKPNLHSKIITTYKYNTKIKYITYNKKWVQLRYKKQNAFINKKYISKKKMPKITYVRYTLPNYSGYKSWMPYTAVTSISSPQYKMQRRYGYTGKYGIRMVKGRYCVAIGSHFKVVIGQYFDLILNNGTVIPCILGDEKDDGDTDGNNIFSRNGCASEFLIDRSALASSARRSGDISSVNRKWNSRVKYIKVYKKNILK